jgi:ribosomal protein S18 acetylase RimI-like enzyme
MSVTIRTLEARDAATLREFIIALHDAERALEPRLSPGASIVDAYIAQISAGCAAHDGAIYVAEVQSQLVGFICVYARLPFEDLADPPGEHAYITDVYVHEDWRRRGIAQAMLARAEQHARERGASELRIGVLAGNAAARALYRGAGFEARTEMLGKVL